MSDSSDSSGDFDQAAAGRSSLRYLARAMHTEHPPDEPFVLSHAERQALQRINGATMLIATALVVFGIWAFYLPHVFWEQWFSETHTAMGDMPLISILFALLVLYLVLHGLLLAHNGAIRLTEMTCQFPRFHDPNYGRHLNQLAENSPQRGLIRLRLSARPLLPWTLHSYLMTVLLLAFLSDGILQLLIRFWSERPITPFVMVLTSTLVVAIWTGWATHRILQQVQVRIMVPLTVRQFTNELVEEFGREPLFRRLLPGVLHQADVPARPCNYPHLLLTETLLSRFPVDAETVLQEDQVLEQWISGPAAVRQGLERLFLFSILIDGYLSASERRQLRRLQQKGVINMPVKQIKALRKSYVRGEGLWV
ncbi:LBF_2804 family protein [Larkinella sp. VNQ87]|uniref:LBF_2804 family protein n=1 Tax=Larkinella sp. VNQ87 TaxID=3400921 RepID=UPI003C0C0ABE